MADEMPAPDTSLESLFARYRERLVAWDQQWRREMAEALYSDRGDGVLCNGLHEPQGTRVSNVCSAFLARALDCLDRDTPLAVSLREWVSLFGAIRPRSFVVPHGHTRSLGWWWADEWPAQRKHDPLLAGSVAIPLVCSGAPAAVLVGWRRL